MHSKVKLKAAALFGAVLAALTVRPIESGATEAYTDWGWPTPYVQISEKSRTWLQQKGWWPLQVAYQAPWSGQNSINIVMDKVGLLDKRGVRAKWQAFPSGPAVNEVIVTGRFQVGNGANFPITSLLDKKIPIRTIAILSPNNLHAVIVPTDSPVKSLEDLKGRSPPATIGLVTGSSAELYMRLACLAHGLTIGRDVILKNMSPSDQLLLPEGLTGVVAWEPTAGMMINVRKNGRIIDRIYPYSLFQGNFFVLEDLVNNVPDVVQALSDAYAEAVLWIRRHPAEVADLMAAEPQLKNFPRELLVSQIGLYNNFYKPTYIYPHAQFWGAAMEPIYSWLYASKRIERQLHGADYAASVDKRFMDRTFEKLGWAVPANPPFIPPGWTGSPDNPPYPDYINPFTLDHPQAFPESGDLTREWQFAGQRYQP